MAIRPEKRQTFWLFTAMSCATSVHKIEANISDSISRRPIKRTLIHLQVCHPSCCERDSTETVCRLSHS